MLFKQHSHLYIIILERHLYDNYFFSAYSIHGWCGSGCAWIPSIGTCSCWRRFGSLRKSPYGKGVILAFVGSEILVGNYTSCTKSSMKEPSALASAPIHVTFLTLHFSMRKATSALRASSLVQHRYIFQAFFIIWNVRDSIPASKTSCLLCDDSMSDKRP
jgi:hypothetical protein